MRTFMPVKRLNARPGHSAPIVRIWTQFAALVLLTLGGLGAAHAATAATWTDLTAAFASAGANVQLTANITARPAPSWSSPAPATRWT